MQQIIDMGKEIQDEIPLDKMLWAPGGGLTRCRYLNYIKVIFLHLLPAILIDMAIRFKGQKPL
jgi:alcohol-forming fatty acyl-CoA reductase